MAHDLRNAGGVQDVLDVEQISGPDVVRLARGLAIDLSQMQPLEAALCRYGE
jgi:hypothetical protein